MSQTLLAHLLEEFKRPVSAETGSSAEQSALQACQLQNMTPEQLLEAFVAWGTQMLEWNPPTNSTYEAEGIGITLKR